MKLEKYKDKKETRRKVLLIGLTVVTLISITMALYKSFANFRQEVTFPMMNGKVKIKKKVQTLTEKVQIADDNAENGLFKVEHTSASTLTPSGWEQTEYRYAGPTPNNYVYFNCNNNAEQNDTNCEKWRIIGLVNVKTSKNTIEQRIKIIRNDSLGNYAWDYQSHNYSNDWIQASLMGMLNDTYYNSLNASTYCYKGSNGSTVSSSTCDFSSSQNLKGLTEKARDMIEKDTLIWNIGGWSDSKVTTDAMYGYERGTEVRSGREAEWNVSNTKDPRNGNAAPNLFRGVGLMYPSDYGYAVGGSVRTTCLGKNLYDYSGSSCYSNDWLYLGKLIEWFLTPSSSTSFDVFFVGGNGYVNNVRDSSGTFAVRPAVYVSADYGIGGGNGTEETPYKLESFGN